MDPGGTQHTETALKQHWKGLKIKSNKYPNLLRRNVPTKGQNLSIPEFGTALLQYAEEKEIASWAELITLNNFDPWSELSDRLFRSAKHGAVLKKLAHLDNAHFESFLNEQLQKRERREVPRSEHRSPDATKSNHPPDLHPSGHAQRSVSTERPAPFAQAWGSGEHARIPKAKTNVDVDTEGSKEGDSNPSNAAGQDKGAKGRTRSEFVASEGASTRRSPHSNRRGTSSSGGTQPPAQSPIGTPAGRHVPDHAADLPETPVHRARSETQASPIETAEEGPPIGKATRAEHPALHSTPRSVRKAPGSNRKAASDDFVNSPSRNTRSQATPSKHDSSGARGKRAHEEAFPESKSGQPEKKAPVNPCPRPGGCPTETKNHIRRTHCQGCNYDIHSHNAARKKAENESKKAKIPALPVVLKAATREVDKLRVLGCSVSLMVHTPTEGNQATRWFYASAGAKGEAFTNEHKKYFRKAMKTEAQIDVKVEGVADSKSNVDRAKEHTPPEATNAKPATTFKLSPNLEGLVKGLADRYPEDVIETMLTALRKHYIDEETAKALDMDALQNLFGKDKLGPCLRFKNSVKDL
ncbi:hypothetical protein KFL_002890130 [Klebsormidium nitens]|uniref:Uncharacterized protein n=1 Tax=Klebsormidium nitens TaxID=105231 RepID=A0A1Y1ICK7_KLENI|nr:hypothetical protein KFL_002890130 [Klebsormidium nitens]|eukprot:GAQ86446.1 hypothetical protein KFL_002890130 [Klebsormidium nitens]